MGKIVPVAARREVDAVMNAVFGPGHEFWKRATEESFRGAAVTMLSYGMEAGDVAHVLAELYGAVADEYGG
jgi:hypothetical protein